MSRCFQCNATTNEKCETCQTPYCSEKCKQENAIDHQVFCHPQLHQRIKSVADYIADNLESHYTWFICSGFYGLETMAGRKLNLSAFGKNHGNGHCMICSVICPDNSNYARHDMLYRGKKFMYFICAQCNLMGKRMCETSFAEVKVCARYHISKKWLTFLVCLKRMYPRVPKDIKRLILATGMVCGHSTPSDVEK